LATNDQFISLASSSSSERELRSSWAETARLNNSQLGMWIFLATVTMLFAGFTSAIFVRREALDWQPIPVPSLLWLNTALLLASSAGIERVRALFQQQKKGAARGWLLGSTLLGILFLVGQIAAWRELSAKGLYLSSNPHSAFFFILTGAHAAHLLGALIALGYLNVRLWLDHSTLGPRTAIKLCSTCWHFFDALWIYLFAMLFIL